MEKNLRRNLSELTARILFTESVVRLACGSAEGPTFRNALQVISIKLHILIRHSCSCWLILLPANVNRKDF